DSIAKAGLSPRRTHRLEALKAVLSTGSPLVPEGFDYVYREIKPDVHLASISGGTDIVSCFVLGNPAAPVRRGEIQCAGLGMDVAVFDEAGRPVTGRKGELVCRRPFHAARLLERSTGHALPRRLLRALPGRLAPRRLHRAHGAGRIRHL